MFTDIRLVGILETTYIGGKLRQINSLRDWRKCCGIISDWL